MVSQYRGHSAVDSLNPTLTPSPAPTKSGFIPRGLGNAYRRIGAKLRHTQSMDMTQQPAVLSRNSHTEGRALHTTHPESSVSTHSESSPRTSQGKESMDIERNTRPFPDKNSRSASGEHFLISPSRMASIPIPLPSHLTRAQPASSTSTSPGSSDSHTSIPSLQTSAPGSEPATGILSSSSSTPRAASPFSPTYNHLSCSRQSAHTAPQQRASSVEALDASSLNVLSDGLGAPLPPIERASNHPASLTPGFPSFRTTTTLSAPSPFPTKFSIEGVSARLSPAIITRQPQHPILSLPPISPTSSPVIDLARLSSRSLRSVPALPMQGSDDQEPAEHDNADLDDLEEEDEGVADGDEVAEEESPEADLPDTASEDGESTSGPHSSGASESRPGNLPAILVSPLDMSFLDANKSGNFRQDDKTPKGDQVDYFNSKSHESNHIQSTNSHQLPSARPSAWTTPLPASIPTFSVLTPAWATAPRALVSPTTSIINPRSGMYHQASRSMSDMTEILRQHHTPDVVAQRPKSPLLNPVPETDTAVSNTEEPDSQLGPSLRRRLSMPTFGPSTAPPAYPEFRFGEHGLTIQPRDEEGREHLPHYTNDIYLRAIMPRKMEFSAPGMQARDRKWRRILCILEGTAFRVYRCPPTATGKGLIGNLWEKTVGVGDISAPSTQENATSAKVNGRERERERGARQTKFDGVDNTSMQSTASPPAQSASGLSQPSNESDAQSSPSSTRSRLINQHFRRKNRASSAASDGPSTSRPEFQARRSFSALQQNTADSSSSQRASSLMSMSPQTSRTPSNPVTPMLDSSRTSRTPRPPRIKRRHLWVDDPDVPLPQEQDLLHSYALHNAESGLGTDYTKRQNVIRIRMEGQQFLLQAPDVTSVVDWVEVRSGRAGIAEAMLDFTDQLSIFVWHHSSCFVCRVSRLLRISHRI
ncbi:hypothetical protein F5888DRAFT_391793 [Russula emetica]|nr:hypothetical protein F5888DRAFT_391793 [Russula emetica]